MEELFSFANVTKSCVFAVVIACMYLVCSMKTMGALQQSGYRKKKFYEWFKRKDNMAKHRLILTCLLMLFSSACFGLCFSFLPTDIANAVSLLPLFFFPVLYIVCDGKYALKVPCRKTNRLKRLAVVYALFLAVFNYICMTLLNVAAYYINNPLVSAMKYFPLALYFPLLPFTLTFANDVCSIYERAHTRKFIGRAKESLKNSKAVKIGVTGSYGKTSVKNILSAILSEKYRVLSTPASFNTPVGVAKCVNENSLDGVEVFIAEMGARHSGDIDELCDIVEPDYSILTGVCNQHLESFRTEENILAEKRRILERAKIGYVRPVIPALGEEPDAEKKTAIVGKDIVVSDVKADRKGTSFSLAFGEEKTELHTKLLSAHSAENIALAAGVAKMLGLTLEEIKRGVEKIDYVEHRLQVIEANGVTILDDSYNANVKGAKDSVEALKLFEGNKFIVTPGLVELGILEAKENTQFGKELVGIDNVILVGDTLVGCVKKGYLAANGDESKLTVVPTLEAAKKILAERVKPNDTVLFLNDLPDVY